MQIEKSITQMKIIKEKNWTFASKKKLNEIRAANSTMEKQQIN